MMNENMSLEEMVAVRMAEDAAEEQANAAFYAACDEAFKEGKEGIECAPTLRSAELPAPVSAPDSE